LPSLSPLIKIARSLGVRLGTFIDDTVVLGPVISRHGEVRKGISFSTGGKGYNPHLDFHPLAGDKSGRHMEPFIVEIEPSPAPKNRFPAMRVKNSFISFRVKLKFITAKKNINFPKETAFILIQLSGTAYGVRDLDTAKVLAVVYAPF
jgi:hypothetical protein